jgi:hypothetical protein
MNIYIKRFFIISLLFVFSFCGRNTYQVYKLSEQSEFINKEGLFYFLPRTVISIEITIEKTDRVKGIYAQYSSKYLGISNVIQENTSEYDIADIKIKTFNEPDPDKIFFVTMPKNKTKKNKLYISLQENGIIESVNYAIDSVLSISQQAKALTVYEDFQEAGQAFRMFVNHNIMEKVDTIFEYIHLDTMTIEKHVLRKSTIEKDMEQRAKEASEFLVKLNDHRVSLVSGYQEVDYNNQTLNNMLGNIDQMIQEYMSLFIGKTTTQSLTYNFSIIPETTTKNTSLFLFSLDKSKGINDIESSNENNNFYLELMPSLTTSRLTPIISNQQNNKKLKKGFYYNIPEKTKLVITKGDKNLIFENSIMVNQFGVVHFLPNGNYRILYDSNSASLRKIR